MSEWRILLDKPGGKIKQLSASRLDESPASEFDIPHYCSWDDGSEYEVFFVEDRVALRRYHGPQFGRPLGDWCTETERYAA